MTYAHTRSHIHRRTDGWTGEKNGRIVSRAANRPGYGYGRQKNGTQTASPVYHTGRYGPEIQRRRFGYGWHTAAYGRLTGVHGKQIQIQFLLKKTGRRSAESHITCVCIYFSKLWGSCTLHNSREHKVRQFKRPHMTSARRLCVFSCHNVANKMARCAYY